MASHERLAIVAGATGLVGLELVRQLARDDAWTEVRALTRRPLPDGLASPRLIEIDVDYAALDPAPAWADATHVFCALGTTMKRAGSPEAFRRVDFEFVVSLARAARAQGARHFLLVTAVSASPASRFFYNRVKGEVEAAVAALGFPSLTIARPSLLLGPRGEWRLAEQAGTLLGVVAPPRWKPVHARQVARALIDAAKRDEPGIAILENHD
ncbi:MAG: NAD(P)H-binding protein, partial [Vicinamibacteria bacterium]